MRKHTKRKVWACANPVAYVIDGIRPTPEHLLDNLRTRELMQIEAFRTGKATKQDWHGLTDMLNLAETMARGGVGPEALEACERAQTGLLQAAKRYEATGRMGMTAAGLQALRDLYDYHDLQRQSISRGEYEKFIAKTINRIRSRSAEVVEIV